MHRHIGWVTGHTYIVYGPLSNGVTQVVYEGTPASPTMHRHFEVIEKYGVTIYYRRDPDPDLHELGTHAARRPRPVQPAGRRALSASHLPGSLAPYREFFGADQTPIVDTWWYRDRGHHQHLVRNSWGYRRQTRLGYDTAARHRRVVDDEGNELSGLGADEAEHVTGYLVLDQPWPAMGRASGPA